MLQSITLVLVVDVLNTSAALNSEPKERERLRRVDLNDKVVAHKKETKASRKGRCLRIVLAGAGRDRGPSLALTILELAKPVTPEEFDRLSLVHCGTNFLSDLQRA